MHEVRILIWRDFFPMKSVGCHIDDICLPVGNSITRWNRLIPIKINVFIWQVLLDRIPMRSNLDLIGVDLDNVLCPIYGANREDTSHFFFQMSCRC